MRLDLCGSLSTIFSVMKRKKIKRSRFSNLPGILKPFSKEIRRGFFFPETLRLSLNQQTKFFFLFLTFFSFLFFRYTLTGQITTWSAVALVEELRTSRPTSATVFYSQISSRLSVSKK